MQSAWKKPPGRPPANSQDQSTADRILQVAADLFMAQGYEKVTVDVVAKECQVTKATVYYYYASKASLFTASVVRLMNEIVRRMNMILSSPKPLRDRLNLITQIRLQTGGTQLDFEMVMNEAVPSLTPDQIKAMRDSEELLTSIISEEFAKEIELGLIRPLPPRLYAHAYVSLLNAFHAKAHGEHRDEWPAEQLAKDLMDFFWSGADSPLSVVE